MTYKIAADSSSNLLSFDGVDFSVVPLKIITAKKEYVDNAELDVSAMVRDLHEYSGKSGSSCPNVADWLEAFGDADRVFALTITSKLSGSYGTALQAKSQYELEHPDRKVYVLDTFSTGATMVFAAEKIRDMLGAGCDFDEICETVHEYVYDHTSLMFLLKSMRNLANNGRVSPAVAKLAGVLGIHVLGVAKEGQISMLSKCRNQNSGFQKILSEMAERGYNGGKVSISHTDNPAGSETLAKMIHEKYLDASIDIIENRALCSFYAELGGIIIGFEK